MEVKILSPRPKSDSSKQLRFEMRMGAETAEKLYDCAEKLGISRAAVIEKGIDLVKEELDKK
ncbi:MAG: CopG family transcriptional regulator [Lawsonibacter sp.]|nr:CopG family transcriptional regulator [Lawsonibacter sp.]